MTAHIPLDLAEKVDQYAATMERSRGWIVKQALGNWVAWEDEKRRMTVEGLADVDSARVVGDDAVEAWIESLDTYDPLPLPRPARR